MKRIIYAAALSAAVLTTTAAQAFTPNPIVGLDDDAAFNRPIPQSCFVMDPPPSSCFGPAPLPPKVAFDSNISIIPGQGDYRTPNQTLPMVPGRGAYLQLSQLYTPPSAAEVWRQEMSKVLADKARNDAIVRQQNEAARQHQLLEQRRRLEEQRLRQHEEAERRSRTG